MRVLDNNRLWLSAGAGYKISNRLALDVGYSYLIFEKGRTDIVAVGNPLNPGGNPSFTAFNYSGDTRWATCILSPLRSSTAGTLRPPSRCGAVITKY